MAMDQCQSLVADLQARQFLSVSQVVELSSHPTLLADPAALAEELVRRGWLTAYQVGEILDGRADDLILGPYVVLVPLGQGGMGQVFKARHRLMNRDVAIKFIRPEYLTDTAVLARFQREVQALAQVAHPNVVLAYDADQINGRTFLVMEFVEGTTLDKIVERQGPLPLALACDCVRQAALGLQHAHERGLVHRDIKPSNLLFAHPATLARLEAGALSVGGAVKILDLGLALICQPTTAEAGSTTLTSLHTVMGTPDFMSPEQALSSHQADIRADIYSLGCTFYFLLVGRPPFAKGTAMEKLMMHQQAKPLGVQVLRSDIPSSVAVAVERMLAKRPEDRYQTPAEVAAALAPFCQGDSVAPHVQVDGIGLAPALDTLGEISLTAPTHRRPDVPVRKPQHLLAVLAAISVLILFTAGGASLFYLHGRGQPPTEKKDPPAPAPARMEFIVAPAGQGTYTTIADALKKAPPRERIRVQPGLYREALVIDREIEIIGEGKAGEVIIEAIDDHCLLMIADSAVVRNVALRGKAGPKGGEFAAVKVTHGRLTLEDTHITAATGPGVVVHGQQANPTLRRCVIEGNGKAGIGVHRGGQATIEDCRIRGNQWGVVISEKGNPLIRNCKILENRDFGVFVFQQGEGKIDGGSVISNNKSGVMIQEEGSYLILQECIIQSNPPCGVLITKGGKGKLFDCTIVDNDEIGVMLSEKGTIAVIEYCRIQRNKLGVGARNQAGGRIEQCDLRDNRTLPLLINPGCDVVEKKNRTK